MEDNNDVANKRMIKYLLHSDFIDEKIADVFRKVKRGEFVPSIHKKYAYADNPLPIGKGQTISAPSIVGFMTKMLDVKEGMKILEVGSGSGWQCAILAEIVGKEGKIFTVERISELVKEAKDKVEKIGYKNVEFVYGDGTLGHKKNAPYDRIIVTAAAPEIPPPLIEQLKSGGKLIIPVGPLFWQDLILVEKNKEIKKKSLMPVMFVPLIGKYGHKER